MATREEIKSEVEKAPEQRLDELYRVVKNFSQDEPSGRRDGFLSRLSRIKIEGPEDFAANFDLYLNGEKTMSNKVKPIPDGYHSVTPYLIVSDGARAIEFYKQAFGATELFRMDAPGGKIGHAEIRIGDSNIMLADEHPEMNARSPQTLGGSPVSIMLYVEDVDAQTEKAIAAGAKVLRPVETKFYGDRGGSFEDPFGHQWHIATHVEDVPHEELERRAAAQHG